MSGRVILRAHDETTSLLCSPIDGLEDIDKLLLILQHPLDFVVVTSTQIDHHVLVAEEEHERTRIVEFVHLVEVGNLVDVAEVNDGVVADLVGDLVEDFVLAHAVWVPVATEADDDQAVLFGQDGLVDVPAGVEMREDDGTHGKSL